MPRRYLIGGSSKRKILQKKTLLLKILSNAHQDNSHCQSLEALNDAKLSFNKIYTNYQIKKKNQNIK